MEKAMDIYTDPKMTRNLGIKALSDALTPIGMAYFFRQTDAGEGDYTTEKEKITQHFTTESIMDELQKMRT